MIAAIAPMLLSLLTSPAGLIGMAVIAGGIAFLLYRARDRRRARAAVLAEQQAEMLRTIERTQAAAQQRAGELAHMEQEHANLRSEIERESHAHDDEPGLSADAVARLSKLGRD